MKIDIREIKDESIWNQVLDQYAYSTMFLSWEWLTFEKQNGKDIEAYVIFVDDKPVGLVPIIFVHAKRGKYAHLRHSPLMDWSNEQIVLKVLEFVKQVAKKKGMHFIRMSPLIERISTNDALLTKLGFKDSVIPATDAERTVVLELTKPEDAILMGMRKNTRNLIRKAEKLGITVKHVNDDSLFDDFEVLYKDTVSRQQWNAYTMGYIRREYSLFASVGKADMFVAYYQEEPVAASIFIRHKNQVIYHFSGSTSNHRNLPSAYLLHWEAIKYYKEQGLELYNMWGVSPKDAENHPWHGLSLFKRGFTDQELLFVHSQDLDIRPFAKLTHTFELIESKLRGYR